MSQLWFLDIAAEGGWDAKGIGKLVADRSKRLPKESRPDWMAAMTDSRIEEVITLAIADVLQGASVLSDYIEEQRAKGRDIDDIYDEVKPYFDTLARPIEEDLVDGQYNSNCVSIKDRSEELQNMAAMQKAMKEAFFPHKHLANWPDDSQFKKIAEAAAADTKGKKSKFAGDALRSQDYLESLMLVGCVNDWSADVAAQSHCFERNLAEHILQLEVPAQGLFFQVLSVAKKWQWRLVPSRNATLKKDPDSGLRGAVVYGPEAGRKARGRDFRIRPALHSRRVEIRILMCSDSGVRVSLVELEEDRIEILGRRSGME